MATRRSIPLKIYLASDEYDLIQQQADEAELSLSRYGRMTLLSPFAQYLQDTQNLKESYEALTLHLAQHFVLLSVLASDLETLHCPNPVSMDSRLRDLLRNVQGQIAETHQALETLLQQLRRQEER